MSRSDQIPGLVSVVIPTYNQAEFLRQALTCVREQTYSQWEAIVVNNFSQDDTVSVVNAFNDSRMLLINFPNDGVIAKSRNLAISRAKGEYIAFLDSDDLWESTKLQKSVDRLRAGFDLVCHAERWFGGNDPDRLVRYGPASRSTYESLLLDGNCISTSATVIRRDVIDKLGGFREKTEFITTEDYDLWLRVAREGYRIAFIDEVLGSFRRHLSSASSSHLKHLRAEIAVIDDHIQMNRPQFDRRRNRRVAHAYYSAARACTRASLGSEGFRLFAQSLKIYPWRTRSWIGLLVHLTRTLCSQLSRR